MTPHSFRHAFATRMLDVTGDLAMVQEMLGAPVARDHADYAHVSDKKLRSAYRAVFGE